jgi:hypothetical protein
MLLPTVFLVPYLARASHQLYRYTAIIWLTTYVPNSRKTSGKTLTPRNFSERSFAIERFGRASWAYAWTPGLGKHAFRLGRVISGQGRGVLEHKSVFWPPDTSGLLGFFCPARRRRFHAFFAERLCSQHGWKPATGVFPLPLEATLQAGGVVSKTVDLRFFD